MIRTRILAVAIACVVTSASAISAQDLSRYRQFQLGMTLVEVAQQAGITSQPRALHARPELIQELLWQPARGRGPSPLGISVREVLFSFYNGQLFRIAVSYLWDRTEGLTVEDMVEAFSVTYGPATLPATEISSSLLRVSSESNRIVAQWEDLEYSVNVFRPSYASTYGLLAFSKRLNGLAQAASAEATRLDEQEAPRRAIERQQKQENEDHARQERVRTINKATFQP
jgi:hypothetical protein